MTAPFSLPLLPLPPQTAWCGMSAVHRLSEVSWHTRRCIHIYMHMWITLKRDTPDHPTPLYRGKVSAPASVMNNWVIWLRAEIAISLHKCENITRHPRPGKCRFHVGLHVLCVSVSVCTHARLTSVFFVWCKRLRGGVILRSWDSASRLWV